MAPAWVRPFVSGVLATATVTGMVVLLARPRHDTIEVLIATPAPSTIAVAVSGEVARPGVYHLPSGSRVADLLDQAGGAADRADPAVPSRALLLRDEMHIHVPAAAVSPAAAAAPPVATAHEPGLPPPATASVAGLPASAPTTPPPLLVDNQAMPVGSTPALAATATPLIPSPPTTPGARPVTATAPAGLINLNTASTSDLERLPGIGPALAERIVADRQRNGPFRRIEDLDRVPGIGPTLLARLRPLVSI